MTSKTKIAKGRSDFAGLVVRLLFLLATVVNPIFAQRPVIDPGGIKNSASYTPGVRGLVTILGSNLANQTATATTTPLPTTLGGTRVTFGGTPAFLLYVSPKQINVQLPLPGGNTEDPIPVVVTTAAGSSDPIAADINNFSQVGLFTADSSGCGQASALNVSAATGAVTVNSRTNSASPGDFISLYGTGLYSSRPTIPVPDGKPAPPSPLYEAGPDAFSVDFQPQAVATWEGVAPGLIGVDQFNIKLDPNTREGCSVPVQVFSFGTTQPVTIAVRKGGGPCVEPDPVGYGEITWERASTTTVSGTTVAETLTASLQVSPGQVIPPAPSFVNGDDRYSVTHIPGPLCAVPGYGSLAAGHISAQLPSGNIEAPVVPLPDAPVPHLTIYRATLPAGTIQPGQFTVSSTGGAGVDKFQSSVHIGSGIQVTTPLANRVIPVNEPLVVNWTGGDPDSWVTVKLVGALLDTQAVTRRIQVRASAGTARFELMAGLVFVPRLTEIVFEVTPDPSQIVTFQAPGIDTVRHSWKYSYHFPARQ